MAVQPNYPIKALMGLSTPFSTTMVFTSALASLVFGYADYGLAILFAFVATVGTIGGGALTLILTRANPDPNPDWKAH